MRTEETYTLLDRWHELLRHPGDVFHTDKWELQQRLLERQTILHRLNELGEYLIDGVPVVEAMEDTNVLLRQLDLPGHSEPAAAR